jgi:hypothetical protein
VEVTWLSTNCSVKSYPCFSVEMPWLNTIFSVEFYLWFSVEMPWSSTHCSVGSYPRFLVEMPRLSTSCSMESYLCLSVEMPWLSTSCSTISRRLSASLGCVLLVRGRLRWTGIKWRSLQENIAVIQHVCSIAEFYSRKCVRRNESTWSFFVYLKGFENCK